MSWAVSISMFVAIVVFGAPVETFFYAVAGMLLFFIGGEAWYERRRRGRR